MLAESFNNPHTQSNVLLQRLLYKLNNRGNNFPFLGSNYSCQKEVEHVPKAVELIGKRLSSLEVNLSCTLIVIVLKDVDLFPNSLYRFKVLGVEDKLLKPKLFIGFKDFIMDVWLDLNMLSFDRWDSALIVCLLDGYFFRYDVRFVHAFLKVIHVDEVLTFIDEDVGVPDFGSHLLNLVGIKTLFIETGVFVFTSKCFVWDICRVERFDFLVVELVPLLLFTFSILNE